MSKITVPVKFTRQGQVLRSTLDVYVEPPEPSNGFGGFAEVEVVLVEDMAIFNYIMLNLLSDLATNAIVQNRFKLPVNDSGEIEIEL